MRREIIGDSKVDVYDHPIDVSLLARTIACERSSKDNDSAFMIINLDAIYDRFRLWQRELPEIEPFYAVKCNSDETMLQTLAALGAGFDCASREEIDIVMRLGVSQDRIIYANTCKTRSHIEYAEAKGVARMTFDSVGELEKIAKYHKSAELVLRIASSDLTAGNPLAGKFGADPVEEAPQLLERAKQLGLSVVGVSFHVGSRCNDPFAYRVALQYVRNLFDIGLLLGHKMEIVDIGGGFPGIDHPTSFEMIASVVRSAILDLFPETGIRFIAEPGRFFAARPFALVTNVIAHKTVSADKITNNADDASRVGHMYYINEGVYGTFSCIAFDKTGKIGRPLLDKTGPLYPSTIWGHTCDSRDKIENDKMTPLMEVGDWMIYEEIGAYTCASSTTFNGFSRPTPIYVISERRWNTLGM